MSQDMLQQLDEILERTPCRISMEEIGRLAFGGLMFSRRARPLLVDVVAAGLALRKQSAFPFATAVPPEIGLFLIALSAERLTDDRIAKGDMGIDKVERRLRKIERRHGVDDDILPWRIDEAPANWQAANAEWDRLSNAILVDTLRPIAPDMADLFVNDLDEFDRRREVGRINLARIVGRDDLARPTEEICAELFESKEEQSAA